MSHHWVSLWSLVLIVLKISRVISFGMVIVLVLFEVNMFCIDIKHFFYSFYTVCILFFFFLMTQVLCWIMQEPIKHLLCHFTHVILIF